jgi:hypothetical protein
MKADARHKISTFVIFASGKQNQDEIDIVKKYGSIAVFVLVIFG